MTESVAFERQAAQHLFDARQSEPLFEVDVLGTGQGARDGAWVPTFWASGRTALEAGQP